MRRNLNDLILYGNRKFGFDFNYLISNYSWMLFSNTIYVLTGLGIVVIFARVATKEVFGLYNFLLSIFALLSVFSMPGMNTAMFRGVSRGFDGTYRKATRFMFLFSAVGVPILFGLGIYYYYFISKILGLCFMFTSIFFPFYYSSKVWVNLLQAKEKFKEFAIYNSISSLVRFIVMVGVILISNGSLLPVFLSFILVDVFVNSFYYLKTLKFVRNDEVEEGWKSTGYKMMLPALFNQFYHHVDKIVLIFFLGATKLAVYSIAVATITVITNTSGLFVRVYTPKIYKSNTDDLVYFIKKRLWVMIFVLALGLVGLYLFIPLIIEILYTAKYSESIVVAQAFLLIIPFHFLVLISSVILFKDKKENFYTFSLVISGIVNVCLYFILIPLLGIIGGVLGSIAFYAIQAILNWAYIMTKLKKSSNT
jgi:O-antigen/teichoic acid export membrane protein